MIIKEELDWGTLRGKMKLTPAQAKEMLNYDLDPKATGVIFQVINGKQIVRSAMPHRIIDNEITRTIKRRYGTLGRIGSILLKDIIRPNWEPMVKDKPLTGFNLFQQHNCLKLGIPADWKNLVLTIGEMPMPGFNPFYCPRQQIIVMKIEMISYKRIKENMEMKVVVFDVDSLKMYPPAQPPQIEHPGLKSAFAVNKAVFVKLPFKMQKDWSTKERPIVIAYFRNGERFSNSNAKRWKCVRNAP